MKTHKFFQVGLFILLLTNEGAFVYLKQYPYAIITLFITLAFIVIVEAFERGLSNIIFKTPQTQLDIKMAEKEIQKASKSLATKLAPTKKKAAIEQTTELIQDNLHAVFQKGITVGKQQAVSLYEENK